ncbi:hypothetical protein ACO0LG_17420 [Undibacterium sp. Ji42W]|uniref:hypothetical protein n=1 Tax=Undibacterium sp. Ji42W TaxID=3413039 RepID=UPI003BF38354
MWRQYWVTKKREGNIGKRNKKICLDVAGFGFIFYSPFSTEFIQHGEDYFETTFSDPAVVEKQATEGRIVGVSTGTPGRFFLEIFKGYPEQTTLERHIFKLRLGVEVRDRTLCIRDLFDLLNWDAECPREQMIDIDDGFYHLTLLSNEPESGVLGDDQVVQLYLQELPEMPRLKYSGVPTLC